MKPYYEHGGITIYHGDCREVLPSLPRRAAIVSDPPYGMNYNTDSTRFTMNENGHGEASKRIYPPVFGDDKPFDPAPWIQFPEVILWGFNHFAAKLERGTTLVWLKRNEDGLGAFLSDAEIAWEKGGMGVYCFKDLSMNAITRQRVHPTQKPLSLMKWCISRTTLDLVIDPFMGSGTTLEAAKEMGRKAIGIEIEEKYCEIAAKRMSQEVFQF